MKLRSLRDKPIKKQSLKEADTKTMNPTDIDWDTVFDDPVSKGDLATAQKPEQKPKQKELPPMRKASAQKTAAAMQNVRMNPQAADMLGGLNIPDDALANEPDLDMPGADATAGATRPVNPDNVPAIISTAIANTSSEVSDASTVNPEWHQVKNLPGYMSKQIRVLGRETFKPFTKTKIEDISVLANLGGQGPNSNREIQAVSKWLKENGTEIGDAHLDYGSTMPGYTAETISYTASGVRFLLVMDAMGHYIYAWPETDSVNQVSKQPTAKQLR